MYLGEIAEIGTTEELFTAPRHPYTEALFSVIPEPDPGWEGEKVLLEGDVPSAIDPPSGCRFHTRCHRVIRPERIDITQPTFRSILTLKIYAREATSTTELITLGGPGALQDSQEDEETDAAAIDETVRSAYDLPDPLPDREAEATLSEAIEALDESGPAAMATELETLFVSPCESTNPELIQTAETQVSCLLYSDDHGGRRATITDADESAADD